MLAMRQNMRIDTTPACVASAEKAGPWNALGSSALGSARMFGTETNALTSICRPTSGRFNAIPNGIATRRTTTWAGTGLRTGTAAFR